MTSITYKSKKYELPVKTLKIAEAEDLMHTESKTFVESYTKQFEYLKVLFDDDALIDMLGSSDINDVDLTEVVVINNLADDAFMENINKQKMKAVEKITKSNAFEKVVDAGKFIDKADKISKKR